MLDVQKNEVVRRQAPRIGFLNRVSALSLKRQGEGLQHPEGAQSRDAASSCGKGPAEVVLASH